MIKIEVNKTNNMISIIKMFFGNYIVDAKEYTLTSIRDRNKRDFEDNLYTNYFTLPYGISNISYSVDDVIINFNIEYIKSGTPVGLDCDSQQHEEMFIIIDETVYTNYKILINKLIEDARNYYDKNIKNRANKDSSLVVCYVWDDFWDDIYKRKRRPLNTVHLNEKSDEVLTDMKKFLSKETELEYETLGLPYKRNYLFEGYPGTGKTSLIYSLASELNMDVAIIQFNNEMDDIKFTRALMRLPKNTLLILEDIDVLFTDNRKKNDVNKNMITLSGLLNILDGLIHQEKQIIVMTTNFKCTLDNALQRPGRIDYTLHFDFATEGQIKAMYNKFLPKQLNMFDKFYKKISHLNITTATLQQFLFQNRSCEDIMTCIDELKLLVSNIDYNGKNLNLYM